jgi:hypothetical protein
MFQITKENNQLDLLSGVPSMLEGKAYDQYTDPNEWHNQFREQVLKRIDEKKFEVLFSDQGAPNGSIRLMLGMMIIKEGFGWSDKQLFSAIRFDLLVKAALGQFNLNDKVIVPSTYYLLRHKVGEYEEKSGENLIEQTFQSITSSQVIEFNVNGNSLRMDSKLMGSNIAYYSRYEIVHETLRMFYKDLTTEQKQQIAKQELDELKAIMKEKGGEIVYRSNKEEVENKLYSLGLLIWKLLLIFKDSDKATYNTLQRVFEDHFKVEQESNRIVIKDKKEISSTSVQSPHDTDCTYRSKGDQKVKGYHANISETCDDDSLNLITSAQMDVASISESKFTVDAIKKSEAVLGNHINNLHTDGAYHSKENNDYCEEHDINFYLTGIQGAPGRYDLSLNENQLIVVDTQTGETIPATPTKSGTWKIMTDKGLRYFKPEDIKICQLRKKIAEMPTKIKYKRNNVEATIFQFCFHSRNNKTRYRGLYKHKIWMFFRCLWINFVRIASYLSSLLGKCTNIAKSNLEIAFSTIFSAIKNKIIKMENKIYVFFIFDEKCELI